VISGASVASTPVRERAGSVPGATGEINAGIFFLSSRTIRNEGELDYNGGQVFDENHPVIDNVGTLSLPGAGQVFSHYAGPVAEIDNSGTIKKPEGSTGTTQINVPIHNEALVEADGGQLGIDPGTIDCIATPALTEPGRWEALGFGQLNMDKPGGCETYGTLHAINSGRINVVDGTSVDVNSIDASNGTVDVANGVLNVYRGSGIGDLIIGPEGTLTGTGEIDVCPTSDWIGGTMSGPGKTIDCPGRSGTVNPGTGGIVVLDGRLLTNSGTLTWASGAFSGKDAGELDNAAEFCTDSEDAGGMSYPTADDLGLPLLINIGAIRKCAGTGTRQQFTIPR
jgi:hypothetical protein